MTNRSFLKNDKQLRKNLLNMLQKISIKIHNFSVGQILLTIGLLFELSALHLPWLSLGGEDKIQGAFSLLFGFQGFLILVFSLLMLAMLFSQNYKRKIKLANDWHIKESNVYIYLSIVLILFQLNTVISIKGLFILSSEPSYHSGVVFGFVGSVLCIFGSILYSRYLEKKNNYACSYELNHRQGQAQRSEKNVTKLPF